MPSSSAEPGHWLGVDYGKRRIGYAMSDELGWNARPLEVYKRRGLQSDLQFLAEIVSRHDVQRVVVGVPYRVDGTTGPAAEEALEFSRQVADAVAPVMVVTQDEAFTSQEADRLLDARGIKDRGRRKSLRDAYAASVILQEYLRQHVR